MEVRIGVQHATRELVVETDSSVDDVEKQVSEAVAAEGLLTLVDNKGRRTLVPTGKLAYVEIGSGPAGQVGFRS